MFNDVIHFIEIIIAIAILVGIVYLAGRLTGMWGYGGTIADLDPDDYDFDEDDDDDDDYDDDDDDYDEDDDEEEYADDGEELPEPITLSRVDHIARLEMRRLKLRFENPRLYSDKWYSEWEAEFSSWLVEQEMLRREELGDLIAA